MKIMPTDLSDRAQLRTDPFWPNGLKLTCSLINTNTKKHFCHIFLMPYTYSLFSHKYSPDIFWHLENLVTVIFLMLLNDLLKETILSFYLSYKYFIYSKAVILYTLIIHPPKRDTTVENHNLFSIMTWNTLLQQ